MFRQATISIPRDLLPGASCLDYIQVKHDFRLSFLLRYGIYYNETLCLCRPACLNYLAFPFQFNLKFNCPEI